MQKTPNVFPIIGQRKIEHLQANIDALSIQLTDEDLDEIDAAVPFDVGFPMNFAFRDSYRTTYDASNVFWTKMAAEIDIPPYQMPVRPRSKA